MPVVSMDASFLGDAPVDENGKPVNHFVMLTDKTGRSGVAIPERCLIYWVCPDIGNGAPIPLYIKELHSKRGITLRCSCMHPQCNLQWKNGKWSGRCISKGQRYDKPS